MTMNTILHLTVRLEAPGTHRRQADLALPAHSSVAEILGEVLDLLHAPSISAPWQPTTTAGTVLDATAPLSVLPLTHGDILVLRPFADTPEPLVVDTAEALVSVPLPHPATHLSAAATGAGLVGFVWWCWTLPHHQWLAFASGALACVTLLALATRFALSSPVSRWVLASGTPIPAGCAAWAYVTSGDDGRGALLVAGLTAVAAMACACVAVQVVSYCPAMINACWGTVLFVLLCGVAAFGLAPHDLWLAGPAAACVGFSLVLLIVVPSFAVHIAGCSVPRLPSAGEDFTVADSGSPPAQTQTSARIAVLLLDGMVLGLSFSGCAGIAAACVLCPPGSAPYVAALCAATSAAVGFHAIRHRSPWSTWALWVWALMCLVCSVATLPLVGFLLVAGCLSCVLWAGRVPEFTPTLVCWFERLEAFAIAVALPLAAHVAGLFVAIRGLG